MAYLPQYENDIYISFARVDNLPDSPTGQGWVDEFHEQLDLELSRRIGRIGAIKISRNFGGDEGFLTARKRAIHESAIFVALVSNGYVISEFCQQALKTFYDAPKRGLGNHSRIFFVELHRVPSESWPKEIRDLAIKTYSLDYPGLPADRISFRIQIKVLARDIFNTLQLLKALSPQESPAADPPKPAEIVKPNTSAVFISYRRGESTPYAGRLYDQLAAHFGDNRVFMDLDTIEPGDDFVEVITNYVSSCSILIALISKTWVEAKDDEGRLRLHNPEDFVNLEISTALQRKIRVIPVLVQGTSMPSPKDLPESLSRLPRRNALDLSDNRWRSDVGKLIKVLEKYL